MIHPFISIIILLGFDFQFGLRQLKSDKEEEFFTAGVNSADYLETDNKGLNDSLENRNLDIFQQNKDVMLSMDLLRDYPAGYNVIPTANPHDVVNVSLQLALYHLVDMNERAQTMTTNCEIITKWHDVFLMWDPAKYDNITDTRLPWEEVWTPDIVLYNAAGDGEQGREMRTLIQVDYQGKGWPYCYK